MRDLEQGRLSFKVESDRLEKLLDDQRRASNSLVRALIFGACVVAGTSAHDFSGQQILGVSAISFTCYVIAAIAGLPLVLSLLTRRS
ncbi:MAG: hypothetical protein R3C68_10455 [Myxococcota bacterium]